MSHCPLDHVVTDSKDSKKTYGHYKAINPFSIKHLCLCNTPILQGETAGAYRRNDPWHTRIDSPHGK